MKKWSSHNIEQFLHANCILFTYKSLKIESNRACLEASIVDKVDIEAL